MRGALARGLPRHTFILFGASAAALTLGTLFPVFPSALAPNLLKTVYYTLACVR